MRRSIVLTGSLLLLPVAVLAQGRGGAMMAMGGGRSIAAAPRAGAVSHMVPANTGMRVMTSTGVRVVPRGSLVRIRTANGGYRIVQRRIQPAVRFTSSPIAPGSGIDVNSSPGLGFDFVHFAAVHPNARPGFGHSRVIGGFFPFFDGGFAIPSNPVVVDDTPVETVDGNGDEVYYEDAPRRVRSMPTQEPAADLGPPAPVPDSSEYVFVRRDGTVFFAVAYSWEQNTLKYVTMQGVRGSVTRDALDLAATQKFNEERGMSFIVPA